jgi:hypothetical protein
MFSVFCSLWALNDPGVLLIKRLYILGWRHVLVVGRNLRVTVTKFAEMDWIGLKLKMIAQQQEVILLQSILKQKMSSSTVSNQETAHLFHRIYSGWEDQTLRQR